MLHIRTNFLNFFFFHNYIIHEKHFYLSEFDMFKFLYSSFLLLLVDMTAEVLSSWFRHISILLAIIYFQKNPHIWSLQIFIILCLTTSICKKGKKKNPSLYFQLLSSTPNWINSSILSIHSFNQDFSNTWSIPATMLVNERQAVCPQRIIQISTPTINLGEKKKV